ncbi:MAG: rRNA pseudouridine synthase [Alphaproteobacteria bacterium]|nr:rRNA pseudouridine synthase [Alphaproteobacteria bacterium]OJV14248.1 MAG: hypothetical protein BGO27_01965 [Alphaproteobacteria bacterium 33-17]
MEKLERIAKVIAANGICSRRDAEKLIEEKKVYCNGTLVEHPSLKVSSNDKIFVDGKFVEPRKDDGIWIYYKPRGVVTTHKDPEGRPTVFELLPKNLPRVISVGRLDINSEGLLILTNNPAIAEYFESPKNAITRTYKVRVFGKFNDDKFHKIEKGITIDNFKYKPISYELISLTPNNTWVRLKLREGKNREIRNIMEHFGLKVARLIREEYGQFSLGDLKPGKLYKVSRAVVNEVLSCL